MLALHSQGCYQQNPFYSPKCDFCDWLIQGFYLCWAHSHACGPGAEIVAFQCFFNRKKINGDQKREGSEGFTVETSKKKKKSKQYRV